MTSYQKKHIDEETLEEYETLHTNFIGNHHEDEDTLDKYMHDFLIESSEKEL
ncbi:hypothetical protein [Fusibacter sp. JL216-2]|uniref:hypothetical protein n=1 Tax=Fusibacter sp. JL216-2 TaxID=3071453 RepID=UPI003D34FCFA